MNTNLLDQIKKILLELGLSEVAHYKPPYCTIIKGDTVIKINLKTKEIAILHKGKELHHSNLEDKDFVLFELCKRLRSRLAFTCVSSRFNDILKEFPTSVFSDDTDYTPGR